MIDRRHDARTVFDRHYIVSPGDLRGRPGVAPGLWTACDSVCGESLFGGRKADIVVGLWDRRALPLERPVSPGAARRGRADHDGAERPTSDAG